jgi:hypothetical protein
MTGERRQCADGIDLFAHRVVDQQGLHGAGMMEAVEMIEAAGDRAVLRDGSRPGAGLSEFRSFVFLLLAFLLQ